MTATVPPLLPTAATPPVARSIPVALLQVPVALQAVEAGSRIAGVVAAGPPGLLAGQLAIDTEAGVLILGRAPRLTPGSRVQVQLAGSPGSPRALLEMLPAAAGRAGVPGALPSVPPLPAPSSTAQAMAPPQAASPETLSPLRSAILLTTMSWQDGTAGQDTPVATGEAVAAGAAGGRMLAPGTSLPVSITVATAASAGPTTTSSPGVAAAPLAPGTQHAGIVSAVNDDGTATVVLPGGAVRLPASADLPAGTSVLLTVRGAPSTAVPPVAVPPLTAEAIARGVPWAAARAAVAWLDRGAPDRPNAQRLRIPAAEPAAVGERLRQFLAALRSGDLAGWLGDGAADRLAGSRPDLLAGLTRDLDQIEQTAHDGSPQNWSVLLVPLLDGQTTSDLRLWFWRGNDSESEAKDEGQRFILDLSFSRLGRMQLDTMIRDAGRAVHLVIRSERSLPADVRDGIRAMLWEEQAGAGDLRLVVDYQVGERTFIEPAPPAPSDPADLVV